MQDNKTSSILDFKMENGLKVKEVIEHIDRCRELREKNPLQNIQAPGIGWLGTSYHQVLEEEKDRARPKKSTPITILLQKEFLKD